MSVTQPWENHLSSRHVLWYGTALTVINHLFRFQVFCVHNYFWHLAEWVHRHSLHKHAKNKNLHSDLTGFVPYTNLQVSKLDILCSILQHTERKCAKNGGWRLQEERWWCLIRYFVLLLLLWWALSFNSAAPVCTGISLLPWQIRTYSHSSGILLILCFVYN